MKVDEVACDKKSYVLGLKKYMSCEVSSPTRDDPLFLADVEELDIEPAVPVEKVDVSVHGTHFKFDEAVDCEISDEGEEVACSVPEERY